MTERLYYSDSYLKSFRAAVTDIRELSRAEGQSVWQVALDRSAFYPTSGGQPHDTGILTAVSRSGSVLEVPVLDVEEDEHGEVWHQTLKPILAGTEVEGKIDWARRLDHMQQHSGQHLLSAVFLHELHAPTVSFHLGEKVSTIDLAVDALAHHSLERVERIANEWIANNESVATRTVERMEAEKLVAEGKVRKLPERVGKIRLVEMGSFDLNACGGTHVSATGQIGGLLIRRVERVRQGFRVEFVCGLRAVSTARQEFEMLSKTASLLSTPVAEVSAGVERLLAEAKVGAKDKQKLQTELASYHAIQLAVEEQIVHHLRVVKRVFAERDTEYVKLLASRLIASVPQTAAVLVSAVQDPPLVVLARSSDLGFHAGNLLKEALAKFGVRGGGSADMAQGQISREQLDELLNSVVVAVRASEEGHIAKG